MLVVDNFDKKMKSKFGKSIYVRLLQKGLKQAILFISFELIVLNSYLTQKTINFIQFMLINYNSELLIKSKRGFVLVK